MRIIFNMTLTRLNPDPPKRFLAEIIETEVPVEMMLSDSIDNIKIPVERLMGSAYNNINDFSVGAFGGTAVEFEIKERNSGDVVILDIHGNLDAQSAPLLKVRLESLVSFGHNKIVINLTDVDFIDSTGVGSLIFGQRIINPIVGGLHIIGLSPQNRNIFSVLNLTEVFSIMPTEDLAVSSFHQDGSTIH